MGTPVLVPGAHVNWQSSWFPPLVAGRGGVTFGHDLEPGLARSVAQVIIARPKRANIAL